MKIAMHLSLKSVFIMLLGLSRISDDSNFSALMAIKSLVLISFVKI